MSNDLHDDPVLALLTDARPDGDEHDDERDTTAQALLARIVAPTPTATAPTPGSPRSRRTRRVRIGAGMLSAAAAIVVAVVAVNTVGVDNGHVVVRQQPAAADVAAIAKASDRAFSSGRAEMTFAGRSGRVAEQGTANIAFAGNNLDVAMHFDGANGRPGFDAHNITVNGQFYLFDQHWIHDVATTPADSDVFDLDPRGLLAVLRPAAGFVVVDTTSTPDGEVRHLRATHPGAVPTLHVALGSVEGHDITSLELWVGADDTVQRLAVSSKHTDATNPCFVQNGVKQCLKAGDRLAKVNGTLKIVRGQGNAAPVKPTVTTSTFTARFTDIGAPISITAPVGAVTVQGKG